MAVARGYHISPARQSHPLLLQMHLTHLYKVPSPASAIQPLPRAAPGVEGGGGEPGKVWAVEEEAGVPRTTVTSR